MIRWVPITRGFNPYFILGSNIFFLAINNLFDKTKCAKWLNRIGNTGKTCKSYTAVMALAYIFFFYLRNRYMGSNKQGEGGAVGKYTVKSYTPKSNLTTFLILGRSIVCIYKI